LKAQQNELNKDFRAKTPRRQRESISFWKLGSLSVFARGILFPISKPNGMANRTNQIKIYSPRRQGGKEKVFSFWKLESHLLPDSITQSSRENFKFL
jgi:hypothetical protein